jgi:hypothetical protein
MPGSRSVRCTLRLTRLYVHGPVFLQPPQKAGFYLEDGCRSVVSARVLYVLFRSVYCE